MNTRIFLIFASALTLAAAGPQIAGRIEDSQGKAIAGARVRVYPVGAQSPSSTTSDKSGSFTVEVREASSYLISAEANNLSLTTSLKLEAPATDLVLRLEPNAQRTSIVVTADAGVVGVVAQREGGAGRQGAHRAGAFELLALGFQGFEAQPRVALGVRGGGMGVGAGLVGDRQLAGEGVALSMGGIDLAAGAVLAHLAVVPAGGVQRGGPRRRRPPQCVRLSSRSVAPAWV